MELSRPRPSNRTTSAVSLVGARIERSVRKSVGARDVRQLIHHYLAIQLASDTADSRAVFQARSESAAVESGPVFHNRRLVAPNYESSKSEKQLLALAKVFLHGQLCLAMVVGLYLAPEASRSIRQICRRWLPKVRRRDRCGFFSFIQFETVFRLRALSIAASAFLRTQNEATSKLERERGCIIAHVFHRNGEPIRSYAKAWNAACEAAGLKGRLVHDLRRTAVRNLERAGVAVRDDEAAWPQDSGCVAPLRDYLSGRLVGRSFQAR